MEKHYLKVETRQELGKSGVRGLRRDGLIPAVVNDKGKSLPVKVERRKLWELLHSKAGENVLVALDINNGKTKSQKTALIREIQHHPVKGDILHLDFQCISLTQEVKVAVPLASKGEPVGVKMEGGTLEHLIWELELSCLPTEIPERIEVDVSGLKVGDSIHVKDLRLSPSVKIEHDPEAIIFSVAPPVKEEVVEPVKEEAPQEPEVIKEKKKEEEEEKKSEEKE